MKIYKKTSQINLAKNFLQDFALRFCAFLFLVSPFFMLGVVFGFGEDIRTLKADFIQKTISQENTLEYSGTLLAKAPAKAKWAYEKPTKKEIYINGKKTTIYEPFLEQVSIGNAKNKIDFIQILREAKLQKDGKYHSVFEDTDYALTLQGQMPKKLEFSDEYDNVVEIIFERVRINEPIDDKEFHFVIPPNVDIIKQ